VIMSRRLARVHWFRLSWAIVLGVVAAGPTVVASPRGSSGGVVEFPTASASDRTQTSGTAQHLTHLRKAAIFRRMASASTFSRRHNRSKVHHRPNELSIGQISPKITRGADLYLEDGAPSCCARASRRSACHCVKTVHSKGLPEALLEAPSPATEQTLKLIGIPAIQGVPPIVILRGQTSGMDENIAAQLP
jgi:hypothetical protein